MNAMPDDPAAEVITPLAYGLLDPYTCKLLLTNVYAREHVARAAADRLTNAFRAYVVVPLFGPDAYATMQSTLDASRRAEAAMLGQNIELRNEIATLRGKLTAAAHQMGLPAHRLEQDL